MEKAITLFCEIIPFGMKNIEQEIAIRLITCERQDIENLDTKDSFCISGDKLMYSWWNGEEYESGIIYLNLTIENP